MVKTNNSSRPTVQDHIWNLLAHSYLAQIESLLKRNVQSDRSAKALQLLDALGEEISALEDRN